MVVRMPLHSNNPSISTRIGQISGRYASVSASIPKTSLQDASAALFQQYPPTQPPSHRRPEFRKTQLHRQYTSLLRSTPMLLLFQHNNLTSVELMGIRRELAQALAKLDKAAAKDAGEEAPGIGANIKMQVINTALFAAALRVVEFYRPGDPPSPKIVKFKLKNHKPSSADDPSLTHSLSRAAYEAVANKKTKHALSPLFSGPLMVVNFPAASPQHLKAVLSILSPSQPQFPPPTRRSTPNYYDPHVQSGLQKLLLLGARIEGQVFDTEGIKYVGSIEGGLDGLRQQLVYLLQGVASGATNTLESAGRNLFLTIEGRRMMLEEEQNGLTQDKKAEN